MELEAQRPNLMDLLPSRRMHPRCPVEGRLEKEQDLQN